VRYADDFVVLCTSEQEANEALRLVGQWMGEAGLELHATKTRITDSNRRGGGFDFLGYHFETLKHWVSTRAMKEFRAQVREMTPRKSGRSMEAIIEPINRFVRGWFEYFKHALRGCHEEADGYIRRRLRSILHCRHRKRGTMARSANRIWPIAYFTDNGLLSLTAARASAKQVRQV
jgi:RNA-directed DNA polymerase